MKSTTSATLDRLRLVVELADLSPADLRHRRDNGASWAEIASDRILNVEGQPVSSNRRGTGADRADEVSDG